MITYQDLIDMVKFGTLHVYIVGLMKKRLLFLILYGCFWLSFFFLSKLLFLVYQSDQSGELRAIEWILIFYHGLKLDLSATSYILVIPFLLTVFHLIFSGTWYRYFLRFYSLTLLILISLIVVTDMELYTHWSFRLDKTPLLYISKPKEMLASVGVLTILRQLLIAAILVFAGDLIYRKRLAPLITGPGSKKLIHSGIYLFLTASLIIPIRGGIFNAPLNTGSAYFHKDPFVNHAGVNILWNVGSSLVSAQPIKNPYSFFTDEKAREMFSGLYKPSGEVRQVLNRDRPNIIIMVLESFTSKIIEPLGGLPGVTPEFNRFTKEGILFSGMYATGDRTDKGIVGILSGYPAQTRNSIIKTSKKNQSLPNLIKIFGGMGYQTAYYYGGSVDFANFRSYLINSGFQRIISKEDFHPSTYNSKWGVHDHILLDRYFEDLGMEPAPFFHVVFTLSSHEPFDVPMETVIHGADRTAKFLNSAYYADESIGEFIRKAQHKEWWKNTLLILVADHGARYPDMDNVYDIGRFKIPMLWLGGAIQIKDTIIQKIGSQTDIPSTVLGQLGIEANFPFSKDLLDNHSESFAYYSFNDGFGFITDSLRLIFDNVSNEYILTDGVEPGKEPGEGKAYLQILYEDFIHR